LSIGAGMIVQASEIFATVKR